MPNPQQIAQPTRRCKIRGSDSGEKITTFSTSGYWKRTLTEVRVGDGSVTGSQTPL